MFIGPKKMFTAAAVGVATCWIPVPFYNVSIRFQQDKILPKELQRGYKNHLHAAFKIFSKDGIYPFIRSAGPLMTEFGAETFAIFYWLDFFKDKTRPFRNFGTDQPGTSDNFNRLIYVTSGAYLGLFHAYPFRTLRKYVEELPKNSKGELFFKSYSEAFWKALGDAYNLAHLWNGFHRYCTVAMPPLFATLWFADAIGLLDTLELPAVFIQG